jgi:hypothetical protein
MNKLDLVWGVLSNVYFCLLNKIDDYHIVTTHENDVLKRIKILDSIGNELFSISDNLEVQSHCDTISTDTLIKCFADNGVHAI